MKRGKRKILLAAALLFPLIGYTQSTKYRSYKHSWGTEKPKPRPVDPQFSGSDAVILEENNTIRIDENNYFFIEKYMRVKLLNENGVQQFSKFSVPETFDPQYDYRNIPYGKEEAKKHWYYDMEMTFFAARAIRPDGTIRELKVTDKIISGKQFVSDTYYNTFIYDFSIAGIEVNDEVEIRYKYVVPYSEYHNGSSGRFFFHGAFPKQDYRLSITYDKDIRYYFFVQNGALPSDTIIANPDDPEVGLAWERKNLFAIKNEPGALPHKDLPYVRFYKHFGDYGVYSKKNIGQMIKVLPYTWQYFSNKRKSYRDKSVDVDLNVTDKNTLGLKRLYENPQQGMTDTSVAKRLAKVHSVIVNDFDYITSYERYKQNNYLYGPGESADKKILYEQYRYDMYFKLMDRTKRMYYLVYLADKRIEDIDYDNYYPILAGHEMFALPDGNEMMYYYPKFARFGYEANELPFYLENVKMVLVPRNMPLIYRQRMHEPQPRFLVSPSSDENINVRASNVEVYLPLDSSTAIFNAHIRLEGQFSTMTRPVYLYDTADSSVNTKYGLRIDDIGKRTKLLIGHDRPKLSHQFPYTSKFNVRYVADSVVRKNDDGSYSIDLTGWFHHIIYDGFSSASRKLSFYPDFRMNDSYTYKLKLNKKVAMLNTGDYEAAIENTFGKYILKIEQVADNEIEIRSKFIVTADHVPAAETKQVEDIYGKIEKLNNGMLKVKVIE